MTKLTTSVIDSLSIKCGAAMNEIIPQEMILTEQIQEIPYNAVFYKSVIVPVDIEKIDALFEERLSAEIKKMAEEIKKEADNRWCNIIFVSNPDTTPFMSSETKIGKIILRGVFGTVFKESVLKFCVECRYLLKNR